MNKQSKRVRCSRSQWPFWRELSSRSAPLKATAWKWVKESCRRLSQEVNGCLLFALVFNNSWVTAECGMKNTSRNHPSLHLLPLCCCCRRTLGFCAVSWNKQSHPPSRGSPWAGPNKQSSFVLVPIIRWIWDDSSLCACWLWWRIWSVAPEEPSELLHCVERLHMSSNC